MALAAILVVVLGLIVGAPVAVAVVGLVLAGANAGALPLLADTALLAATGMLSAGQAALSLVILVWLAYVCDLASLAEKLRCELDTELAGIHGLGWLRLSARLPGLGLLLLVSSSSTMHLFSTPGSLHGAARLLRTHDNTRTLPGNLEYLCSPACMLAMGAWSAGVPGALLSKSAAPAVLLLAVLILVRRWWLVARQSPQRAASPPDRRASAWSWMLGAGALSLLLLAFFSAAALLAGMAVLGSALLAASGGVGAKVRRTLSGSLTAAVELLPYIWCGHALVLLMAASCDTTLAVLPDPAWQRHAQWLLPAAALALLSLVLRWDVLMAVFLPIALALAAGGSEPAPVLGLLAVMPFVLAAFPIAPWGVPARVLLNQLPTEQRSALRRTHQGLLITQAFVAAVVILVHFFY